MDDAERRSHPERIRAGDVAPWIELDDDAAGARASTEVCATELDSLGAEDARRAMIAAQRQAWLDRAAVLQEHRL